MQCWEGKPEATGFETPMAETSRIERALQVPKGWRKG